MKYNPDKKQQSLEKFWNVLELYYHYVEMNNMGFQL